MCLITVFVTGINYDELQRWIKMKAFKEGGSWKSLLANPEVIQIAHEQACIKIGSKSSKTHKRVFDVTEFRLFLMHLFSISVLWVHFKNADQWEAGYDIGNDLLNLIEFRIAVQTLCRTHANEEISDEQLAEDFKMLDTQSRNHIGFLEVSIRVIYLSILKLNTMLMRRYVTIAVVLSTRIRIRQPWRP